MEPQLLSTASTNKSGINPAYRIDLACCFDHVILVKRAMCLKQTVKAFAVQ